MCWGHFCCSASWCALPTSPPWLWCSGGFVMLWWLEGSAGSALQLVLQKVVSPPDCTSLPQGMFVMALSKPYQIESLPKFPALMPRTDLLLPILEGLQFSSRFVAKTAASLQHHCVRSRGLVASVVSLEDVAQCHRALQWLCLSNVVEVICVTRCAEALRQAGACCEDVRVYHVI